MSKHKYVVRVVETRGLRQKFHVRIESGVNGQVLFWSEKYRDRDYAVGLADTIARSLRTAPSS